MKHLHFDEINSTQDYLMTNFSDLVDEQCLISAKKQSAGRGRGKNIWDTYENSLAFSFSLTPNNSLTLTPLEISCLVLKYINSLSEAKHIQLKWPNDLLGLNNKKCAGILVQIQENTAFIGVGINWGLSNPSTKEYKTGKASIFNQNLNEEDFKNIPAEIYKFILSNRMTAAQIINYWNENCAHLDSNVTIIEDEKEICGIFKGIGPSGEAHIEVENKIIKIYNGSLLIS